MHFVVIPYAITLAANYLVVFSVTNTRKHLFYWCVYFIGDLVLLHTAKAAYQSLTRILAFQYWASQRRDRGSIPGIDKRFFSKRTSSVLEFTQIRPEGASVGRGGGDFR
jgi:hypothetical protein